jgi:hypothetical protein
VDRHIMARTALLSALAFLLAAVIIYPLALFAGLMIGEAMGVSQSEGAFATMIGSTVAPVVAVAAGIIAAIWTSRRAAASAGQPTTNRAVKTSRWIGIIGGAVAGYLIGWALRWLLFEGAAFDSYWQAYAVVQLPLIGAVVGGIAGWALSRVATPPPQPGAGRSD